MEKIAYVYSTKGATPSMPDETIYAEDIGHYWKTSSRAPDSIMEDVTDMINEIGTVTEQFYGMQDGRAAYAIGFTIAEDQFRLIWPVLQSRTDNTLAAKRQAVTAMKHDVKARVVAAKWLGNRNAFLPYLRLPSGRTAMQSTVDELAGGLPPLLAASNPIEQE